MYQLSKTMNFPMDSLMKNFFDDINFNQNSPMKFDIKDLGNSYKLVTDLPGLKKEDINVEYKDNLLTIRAFRKDEIDESKDGKYIMRERRSFNFARQFKVENIKENEITAKYLDGILEINLPKKEEEKLDAVKINIE